MKVTLEISNQSKPVTQLNEDFTLHSYVNMDDLTLTLSFRDYSVTLTKIEVLQLLVELNVPTDLSNVTTSATYLTVNPSSVWRTPSLQKSKLEVTRKSVSVFLGHYIFEIYRTDFDCLLEDLGFKGVTFK